MFKGGVMKTIKIVNIFFGGVVLAGLATCGGGGGGAPSMDIAPSTAPVPTIIQGFYSGTLSNKEVVSVVTPGLNFFALHFNTANNPDIYSGKLSLGFSGAAATTSEGLLANVSGVVRTGTATFTNGSPQAYSASLKLASQLALDFSAAAPESGVYQITTAANLDALKGRWQGVWSDGGATTGTESAPFGIDISQAGEMTLPGVSLVNSCRLSAFIAPLLGANIYSVDLNISVLTGCVRTVDKQNGVAMKGVAVIYKSPVAGKTERLELVVVDGTGSGLSFRADR